ncbi:hypothetical protein [Deinococcus sp. ME38]|uniref:hypothetical protein n=1 Tax=Deinococcus sp. ME38 TaxID=3400344 RepID=UPI003B5BF485
MSGYKGLSSEVLDSLPNDLKNPEELERFLISNGPIAFKELKRRIIASNSKATPEMLLLNVRTFGINGRKFQMSDIIISLIMLFLLSPIIIDLLRSRNLIFSDELVFCKNIAAFSVVKDDDLAFRKDVDIRNNKARCLDSKKYKDLNKKYDISGKTLVSSVQMGDAAVETSVAKIEFQLPESPVNIFLPSKTPTPSGMHSGSRVYVLALRPRNQPTTTQAIFIGKDSKSNTVSLLISKENAEKLVIGNEGSFQIMTDVK